MTSFRQSVKGRVFLGNSAFIALLVITLSIALFFGFRNRTFSSVDHELQLRMQLVTGLIEGKDRSIEIKTGGLSGGEYEVPRSGHYYKLVINRKDIVASPSLPDKTFNLASGSIDISDPERQAWTYMSRGPKGEPLRVLRHDLLYPAKAVSAFIAEDISGPLKEIETFGLYLIIGATLIIATSLSVELWLTGRALQPLSQFCDKIAQKNISEKMDDETDAREVQLLTSAFNAMIERLQKAFDAERRLVSQASHTLKTPVSVIKGNCDVYLQKARSYQEYEEALKSILSVTDSMSRLINDLISVARLDSGSLAPTNFKEIGVKGCIDDALMLIRPLAEKMDLTIVTSLPEDLQILGDRTLLTEAIFNILINAVTYNKERGTVEISAWENDGKAYISITDTGMGIRKDEHDRIFERFYRSEEVMHIEGTGLGLSIAKEIVEAHQGELRVESTPGEGSRFILVIDPNLWIVWQQQ